MARALQTLVISRHSIIEPPFSSIEEWLGQNTEDYYSALAVTGQGSWRPRGDAHLWLAFNLRAHHMQAQTVARRVDEASAIWLALDDCVDDHGVPARTTELLYEAVLGYRVRRSTHIKAAGVEERTATRDLARLVDAGLLDAQGERRGRWYTAGAPLRKLRQDCRERRGPLTDPYPWMRSRLAETAA